MPENLPEKLMSEQEISELEERKESPIPKQYVDLIPDEVVRAAQKGGYDGHEAKNRVVMAYLPLIRSALGGFRVDRVTWDDLYQVGAEALIKAIKTWNPERVKFAPYVWYTLRSAITRALNKTRGSGRGGKRKKTKMVHLDKPLSEEGGATHYRDLPSPTPTPEAELAQHEEEFKGLSWQRSLMDYVETMSGRDGELLRARYIEQLKYKALVERFNAPESSIKNWIERALERVRQALPELQEVRITPVESYRGLSSRKPSAE